MFVNQAQSGELLWKPVVSYRVSRKDQSHLVSRAANQAHHSIWATFKETKLLLPRRKLLSAPKSTREEQPQAQLPSSKLHCPTNRCWGSCSSHRRWDPSQNGHQEVTGALLPWGSDGCQHWLSGKGTAVRREVKLFGAVHRSEERWKLHSGKNAHGKYPL